MSGWPKNSGLIDSFKLRVAAKVKVMQTKFHVLAELGDKLEKTASRILMVDFVSDFLRNLSSDEIKATSAMILGRYFPQGDSKTLEVS
jgi:hypothetical protein